MSVLKFQSSKNIEFAKIVITIHKSFFYFKLFFYISMTVYKTMVLDYESNQASEVDQSPKPLLLIVHHTPFEPGLCL